MLALLAAACGGSDATTTTTAPVATTTTTIAETTTSEPPPTTTTAPPTTTAPSRFDYPYDFARHPASPVIQPEQWDASYTAVPWVLREGGDWQLLYAGATGADARLGIALAADGITFERHPDNPLFAPTGGLGWFSIAEVGDQWVMWYVIGFGPPYSSVSRASAPALDGPWTDEGEAFEAPGREWDRWIVPTGVTEIDGTYYLPYAGFERTRGGVPSIGILTSSDGVIWEPTTEEPIYSPTDGTWDGMGVVPTNIIETPHGLELFFLGFEEPPRVGFLENTIPLGRLISADGGVTWTADNDGQPVADTGEAGWPGVAVTYDDGEYRLYLGDDLGSTGISLITGTIP